MTERPKTYLLYLRQSVTRDDPSESLSISFQERALREMVARELGIVLEPPIIDADQRGWDPDRPGLKVLFERIEMQQPYSIGVYAMSRFARDAWLQEGLWRRAKALQPDIVFSSVTEPHAHDEMVRGILGVISQAERKRMGAFLRSAFQERARQGKQHGRAPYGYRKDDNGRLVIEPSERDVLLETAAHFEAGWSLRRLSFWLHERAPDDRRWQPATVRDLLTSPTLAGAIKSGEHIEWDCHEAIIDRDRHERLVALMDTRRWVRTKRYSSWLERLIICGCGAPMDFTGKNVPEHRGRSFFRCAAYTAQYRFDRQRFPPCTSTPRYITADRAERLVIEALTTALNQIPDAPEVEQRARARYSANEPDGERQRRQAHRDLERLTVERDRLLVLYRRATIEVERWEQEDALLARRIDDVRTRIAAIPEPPTAGVFEVRHRTLRTLAADVNMIAGTMPDELAAIMRKTGITAQLHEGGIRLIWPPDLEAFFAEF